MPVADLLPELILLVGAAVIVILASFLPHRLHNVCAALAMAVLAGAGIAIMTRWGDPAQTTFSGTWALDVAARFAKGLILVSALVAVALSPRWMASDRRHGEYYAIVLFAVLGTFMLVSATDTMELIIGVLLSSVTGYALTAYHRQWSPSQEAAMKYFLIGALANALLALGVVLLFGLTGQTGYQALSDSLREAPDPWVVLPALVLLLIGLGFKLGAAPAHMWMPDVAQAAPAPVAALMTVITKVGAAIALARLTLLIPDAIPWRWLIAVMALVTMTWGNLAALWQTNLRRLLGWSAVSQSGYALMAIVVLGLATKALAALLVFLAGYAVANLAAFSAVTYLRGRTDLEDYRGLAHTRPWTAAVIIVALLSFLGLPPLVGFFGKLLLFETTIAGGFTWLAVAAVINTVLSLFYYLRVASRLVFSGAYRQAADLGWQAGTAMAVAGAAVLVLGLAVNGLIALASHGGLVTF